MKAILMSIKPKWCEKIFSGEKTVEVRKVAPKLEPPFKVYVYETLGSGGVGAVIGEFVCDEVNFFIVGSFYCDLVEQLSCVSYEEMIDYFYKPEELDGHTVKVGRALHITAPKRYDTPKELNEFVSCKYYKDEECLLSNKTHCKYRVPDLNPDGSVNIFECKKRVTRPPQSWMYVEEMAEESVIQNDRQR